MANIGVKGRVLNAVDGKGIKNLTVKAVDFDPFFNEDEILVTGKTGPDGRFALTYSPEAYSFWKGDRKPDLVVWVLGPAGRLLFETKEEENVTVDILDVGDIRIHPNHIDGWLVTHATLKPENGDTVALFHGNEIEYLIDGGEMFPEITKAAQGAKTSINLMNLFFNVGKGLITKFKSSFDPVNPPSTKCKDAALEANLEEVLKVAVKKTASGTTPARNIPVNVLVTDIPAVASDTSREVREFFDDTGVKAGDFNKGLALLHARAMIRDGVEAIIMGSSIKQGYFSDTRHAIRDARHNGSLLHDVNVRVTGPAVAQISKTFATIWKVKNGALDTITIKPEDIPKGTGPNVASVQVLRTLPGGTFTSTTPGDEFLPHGETGILEAYQRAIANAERFIYFENQYFTSPDIVDALIARMNADTEPLKSKKLNIILVLNIVPDLPGYPDRQVQYVKQLKAVAEATGHKLGVYSLWSRSLTVESNNQKKFEIMPIYVHSKSAIIDDTWATTGTANLDGTSMNYHQTSLIVNTAFMEFLEGIVPTFGRYFINGTYLFMLYNLLKLVPIPASFASYAPYGYLLLAAGLLILILKNFDKVIDAIKDALEITSEVSELPEVLRNVTARPAQHALPNRTRQPARNVEMNVVLYNGIAGQPASPVASELRQRLWKEHLDFETLPAELQTVPPGSGLLNWVDLWDARAKSNLDAIAALTNPKADQSKATLPGNRVPKVLAWTGKTKPDQALEALKIRTKGLRSSAQNFDFKKCKFDPRDFDIFSILRHIVWPL
jgi:phosphatidylserine/phosphatidylglycerophosphate/cardiolipin synthase-like enzyme